MSSLALLGAAASAAIRIVARISMRAPVLVPRGEFYYLPDGTPLTIIETSDFSLFKRHLDGEDIRPVCDQRAGIGFNMLRVWLLNLSVIGGRNFPDGLSQAPTSDGLHPTDYPQFYDELPRFHELCGSFGLLVENTVFTSTRDLMPAVSDQVAHLQRTVDALRPCPNAHLELVNEGDQNSSATSGNAVDPSLLAMKPAGIHASSGSNGADSPPPAPNWDYVLYHSNGLDQWWRKVGHNVMEDADNAHLPGRSNENTRFPDQDGNVNHAYDAAREAALLSAGSCFHSMRGKQSRLFDIDLPHAQAWVAGAKSVPLEFRVGRYVHRPDLENADIIRAYDRVLPDGRAYTVEVRA